MNRGNRKAVIFEDERDRRRFLGLLLQAKEEFSVDVHLGCLMGNHFHLVVGTPHGNLPDFMQRLEGEYARYSNWRHGRVGHVFQGRYRRIVIENDIHFLTAACYVFMNPVTAGISDSLEGWKWSTYAATAGLSPVPGYLSLEWLEALFPSESLELSQQRFRVLMSEAKPVHAYLGEGLPEDTERFRHVVRSFIGEKYHEASLPRLYRSAFRPKLAELLSPGTKGPESGAEIYRAHVVHGYSLREIAEALGIHRDTAGKYYRSFARKMRSRIASDEDRLA